MGAKHLVISLLLTFAVLLSGCALLPEEEPLRTAPLIEKAADEQYDGVIVERGDLILTESVSCRYVPVQTAKLSFALGGEYIDRFFVEAGDTVSKGQLLGRLQLEDIESRIEEVRSAIADLDLQISYAQDLHSLEMRRFEITGKSMDEQARQRAYDALLEQYDAQMRRLGDDYSLKQLTLESLQKQLDERCIFAPFDGTVTQVSKIADGEMSVFGSNVITIVDSTASIFRAETEYWDKFVPGDRYEIVVNKKIYPTVVTDEAELGLESTDRGDGKYGVVYFALEEPSFELEEGDLGKVTLTLDQRLNVLNVPVQAVSSVDGQAIVYYLGEDGLKTYKPVETGLTVDDRIEIVSGLSEGESIIAD